jgi:predicted Zn finger-like uncharacterized protein
VKKSDVVCPECGAGFRRIELSSRPGTKGEYRCPPCSTLLEVFDGDNLVTYRLTIVPPKYLQAWLAPRAFNNMSASLPTHNISAPPSVNIQEQQR